MGERETDGRPPPIWQTPGVPYAKRKDPDRRDKSQWELGLDGQPADPFKDTRYIYLVDPDTALPCTYATWAVTYAEGFINLGDAINRMRGARPAAVAVVELTSRSYKTKVGPRQKPIFKIVGWRDNNGGETNPAPRIEPPKPKPAQTAVHPAFDDQIPAYDEIPW
jgi:hypothetical protein